MHEAYLDQMLEVTKRGAERYLEKPSAQAVQVKWNILFGTPAEEIVD
jgi:hypothetical protein